jgi:hypothetical protein
MTDLEMTKLCAEAMGLKVISWNGTLKLSNTNDGKLDLDIPYETYKPLHDDAQAMALVKKLHLALGWDTKWYADGTCTVDDPDVAFIYNDDLNRAVVECVAKMQFRSPA